MGKFKDLIGMKFGRLTVLERAPNKGRQARWLCQCECGKKCVVPTARLNNGNTQSCGCLRLERMKANHATTHKMAGTKIYKSWCDLKRRCTCPTDPHYERWGGRGIKIYEPWFNDFQAFYDYVSKLPHYGEEGYTLDRINNDGNYEPGNLRWADADTQCRNKRNNIWIDYNGEQMILKDASRTSGLPYAAVYKRYRRGARGDRLFRPLGTK